MGKLTKIAIFNSYVSLPDGRNDGNPTWEFVDGCKSRNVGAASLVASSRR